MIDQFIDNLGEPYLNQNLLSKTRFSEIDKNFLAPLERRHNPDPIPTEQLLAKIQSSIDQNKKSGLIRQWKRCCHGVADFLLRPRLKSQSDRYIAAGVVVRLSGYCNTDNEGYKPFRSTAQDISEELWNLILPDLKSGGQVEIDPEAGDPMSIWALAQGPAEADRDSNEIRRMASRIINFMAKFNFLDGLKVSEADKADVFSKPSVFEKFDVNSRNVDYVAIRVQIAKDSVQSMLDKGFEVGLTYHPRRNGMSNNDSRAAWFQSIKSA